MRMTSKQKERKKENDARSMKRANSSRQVEVEMVAKKSESRGENKIAERRSANSEEVKAAKECAANNEKMKSFVKSSFCGEKEMQSIGREGKVS